MKLNNEKGMVLRIERTSIHDGDGLRTVVFMKGCPLKCLWCSTPESQEIKVELGHSSNKCNKCGLCIDLCPQKALAFSSGSIDSVDLSENKIIIDRDKCDMCLICYDKCPYSAYKKYGSLMSAEELAREISKDEIFYFHSGGGVTFSGGEPLNQSDFVAETMRLCKDMGIHTAIETSLYSSYENIEKILPWLDALYVDIKHMDRDEHKKYTDVYNDLILENIMKVDNSKYPVDIYVRIPTIPHVNSSRGNLLKTTEFCGNIKKLKEIELLPYHRLGTETYKNMQREYLLPDTKPPSPEEMFELVDLMQNHNPKVKVRTGGGFTK